MDFRIVDSATVARAVVEVDVAAGRVEVARDVAADPRGCRVDTVAAVTVGLQARSSAGEHSLRTRQRRVIEPSCNPPRRTTPHAALGDVRGHLSDLSGDVLTHSQADGRSKPEDQPSGREIFPSIAARHPTRLSQS